MKRARLPNGPANIRQRCHYVRDIARRLTGGEGVSLFFFEVSSLSESGFKKEVWSHPRNPNSHPKLFSYKLTHIIMCVNAEGLFFCQFLRENMSKHWLIVFLAEVERRLSCEGITPSFVLDQHRMHLNPEIKSFWMHRDVRPLLTPYPNMIEFILEKVKQGLSWHTSMH